MTEWKPPENEYDEKKEFLLRQVKIKDKKPHKKKGKTDGKKAEETT